MGPRSDLEELVRLLAGTAGRRRAQEERIRALAGLVDIGRLAGVLSRQGVAALLGARLASVAHPALPEWLARDTAAALERQRASAEINERVASELAATLESQEVPCLILKGPALARRLYGDPGLRRPGDVDLLVHRRDLARASDLVSALGYTRRHERTGAGGLPELHIEMSHPSGRLPPVDLHWRVHWYEEDFAARMLARAETEARAARRARPADELAALLLFFARDGFVGVRLAADLAAWWDLHGGSTEDQLLDAVIDAHPALEGAFVAAALAADEVVGVPAQRLMRRRAPRRREVLAARFADPLALADPDQLWANAAVVDWLLSPPRSRRRALRRHLLPRPAVPLREALLHPTKVTVRGLLGLRRVLRPTGYRSKNASTTRSPARPSSR